MFKNEKLPVEKIIDCVCDDNNIDRFKFYEIYDFDGEKELKEYLKDFRCKEKIIDKIIIKTPEGNEILDSHNGFYKIEIKNSTHSANLREIEIFRVSDGKYLGGKVRFQQDCKIEYKTIEKELKLTKEIKKWLES